MESRCFPCLRQRDYDDASPLVDPISRDRVSVAASLALEETERRIAATLSGRGDSSVYVGAPGVAYYLYRAGDVAGARTLEAQVRLVVRLAPALAAPVAATSPPRNLRAARAASRECRDVL